jgi:hypothetical protein
LRVKVVKGSSNKFLASPIPIGISGQLRRHGTERVG